MEPTNLERFPLQAHLEELRGRCEAIGRFQGGSTHYEEELHIFNGYAHEQGFFIENQPPKLSRPPSDEGNEHQVWFREESGTFLKATWPGFFGLKAHRLSGALLDIVAGLSSIPAE